jgi:adenosylcobyric acid synthase
LRRNGCAQAIIRAHRDGATVLGICGGYQMMGVEVCDPDHVEGDIERLPGLALLPTTTTMSGSKRTRQVEFSLTSHHSPLTTMRGYEIHMGETRPFGDAKSSPLTLLDDGTPDGYIVNEKCMGTYLHGILDNAPFVDFLLSPYAEKISQSAETFDYVSFKEEQYNRLAEHVRHHVDMEKIYEILS